VHLRFTCLFKPIVLSPEKAARDRLARSHGTLSRRSKTSADGGIGAGMVALPIVRVHKQQSPQRRIVSTVSRPSLKITRHDDRTPPLDVSFEVWNPITGSYEPTASLDHGLKRQTELAEKVRMMWVQQDPARSSIKDAPDPSEDDDTEWAEFRVSAQANRVYETRNFDQRRWKQALNRTAAIETTCNEVGYVPS
jgi:hypothetical protein